MRHLEQLRGLGGIELGVDGTRRGRPLDGDPGSTEDQQVEVELARSPATAIAPAELALEALERREEVEGAGRRIRTGRRVEGHDRVAELGLVDDADRLGGVQARHGTEADGGQRRERANRRDEGGLGIADVRAEADVRADATVGHGCLSGGG